MNRLTVFYDHIRQASIQEKLPIEQICRTITEAGISGIETDYLDIAGEDGEAFAKNVEGMGLPISSVYCHFLWNEDKPAQDYMEVLKRLNSLGIKNLLAIPGFMQKGQSAFDGVDEMIPYMRKLCEAAKEFGIQILMEDFDGEFASFGTSDCLKRYMDAVPEIGCAFDTGNFMFFGEDELEALEVLRDKIVYVHCKDRSITPVDGETPLRTLTGKALYASPVGKGVIAMKEVLTDILSRGYEGPLAIEHFGSQNQLLDMLESAKFIKELMDSI